jgi:hypothetical protein
MTTPSSGRPLSPARAILYGTLAVGILDFLDATIFFGLFLKVGVQRVWQSVASGLLGKASFEGGLPTAVLGVCLHFFIAFGIVTVYYLVSRKLRFLTQRPVLWGLLYGVAVYFIMSLVVVPLSRAASHWPPSLPVFLNGIIGHALLIGLPAAIFASRAVSGSTGRQPSRSW